MTRLWTLGTIALERDGHTLRLPTKCVALLAYLCAVRRRPVSRQKLALLLWGQGSDKAARHSLNQALYTLRRTLGPNCLAISDTSISVSHCVAADFTQLEEALDRHDIEQVRQFETGPFLEGVLLDDAPDFMSWRDRKIATLERKLRVFYKKNIEASLDRHAGHEAELLARRAIERFPASIPFCLNLIASLLIQHRVTEAGAFYTELEEQAVLEGASAELPSWEDLKSIRLVDCSISSSHQGDIFIGRVAELDAALSLWRGTCRGQGSVLLVRGKPGIGKTYLRERCVKLISNARVFRATAYEAEQTIGFSLVAEVLDKHINEQDLSGLPPILRYSLCQVVPDITLSPPMDNWPQLGQEAGERRLFEAVTRCLTGISTRQPLLIAIDDLQWADGASLAWLDHFIRRIQTERIMIVATCRSDCRTSIDEYPHVTTLMLTEFGESEVRQLLEKMTGEIPKPTMVSELWRLASGHPMYTAAAISRLSKAQTPEIPAISRQLDQTSPENRHILAVLAVVGLPMTINDLAELTALSVDDLPNRLRQMPSLCLRRQDGLVELAHDLVRAGIYESLPQSMRHVLHAQLGTFFEKRLDMVELAAQHWAKSGNRNKTIDFALRAAAESESKHAGGAAAHFYEIAIEAMTDRTAAAVVRARLAELLVSSGQFESAIPHLVILSSLGDDDFEQLKWRSKHLHCQMALPDTDPADLLRKARELESAADSVGSPEVLFSALRTQVLVQGRRIGDHSFTRERDRLVRLSQTYPLSPIGTHALRFVAHHMAMTADALQAHQHAAQACDWADQLGDPELIINCLCTYAMVQYYCGDLRNALKILQKGLIASEDSGAVLYRSLLAHTLACVLVELDAREQAETQIEAVISSTCLRDAIDYITAMANKALVFYCYGDYVACIASADKMLLTDSGDSWLGFGVRGVRGLARLELGGVQEATREAAELSEVIGSAPLIAGDISYPVMLIARVAVLRRTERTVEGLIRQKWEQYEKRDFICRRRLQLALADVTARTAPLEALALAEEVARDAEPLGLKALHDQSLATIRRIRRRHGLRLNPGTTAVRSRYGEG